MDRTTVPGRKQDRPRGTRYARDEEGAPDSLRSERGDLRERGKEETPIPIGSLPGIDREGAVLYNVGALYGRHCTAVSPEGKGRW